MEYVTFILLILFLAFLFILLTRVDKRTKNKWRKNAYDLLEMNRPDPEEVIKTIKYLRLYGGRIRRDKEFIQLVMRLQEKLDSIDGYQVRK